MAAIAPVKSGVQSFINRNSAVQGIQKDGAISSKMAQASANVPGVQTEMSARRDALRNQSNTINDWGQRQTQLKQAAVLKQQSIAAEKAAAAEKARANTSVSFSGQQSSRTPAQKQQGNSNVQLSAASGTGIRSKIIQSAQKMIGTPYAWGGGGIGNSGSRGTGKGTQNVIGVDCSGLTSYVYGLIGVKLPRQSDSQLTTGVKTNLKNAQPGDLVGWGPGGHVAIYAGNGQIIEAPSPGGKTRVRTLSASDYSRGVYAVRLRLPGE